METVLAWGRYFHKKLEFFISAKTCQRYIKAALKVDTAAKNEQNLGDKKSSNRLTETSAEDPQIAAAIKEAQKAKAQKVKAKLAKRALANTETEQLYSIPVPSMSLDLRTRMDALRASEFWPAASVECLSFCEMLTSEYGFGTKTNFRGADDADPSSRT